jgi:cobalt-precorrin-5B (C1)-methyltransferase
MEIFAEVRKRQDGKIVIEGGRGIGRITRKGFWGEVGEAAINPMPRRMIREALRSVSNDGWDVLIYAPQGEEIARKTFNPNLGIEGGISILGTTGIVEPMSDEALKKTIYLEIDAVRQSGVQKILLYLGSYGERVIVEQGFDSPKVKVSNFIGDALLYCYNVGFRSITLIGHIGKLCKLSIGAFNTHNKVCDVRIEAFVYYLALADAPKSLIQQVTQCTTSEEVLNLLFVEGYEHILNDMREGCIARIKRYVKDQAFDVEVILYSMEYGVL